MPRMRPAIRSAWNSSSASSFSPTPTKRMGAPVTFFTEIAAPPRVSESNLVRMTPSTSSRSWNSLALLTASCPVIASTTRKIWCGPSERLTWVQLVHQVVVDVQPPGRIEDQRVDVLFLRFLERVAADLDRDADGLAVLGDLVRLGVEHDLRPAGQLVVDLVGDGLELLDRGRSLQVGGAEHDAAPALLEVPRELAAGCGLARALQPAHHDDGRPGADAHDARLAVAAEELDEPLMDDADHLLPGLEALGDLGAERVVEDGVAELVDDVDVDVGLEERRADVAHRLADVGFGDLALAGELAEDVVEPVGEPFEHGSRPGGCRAPRRLSCRGLTGGL